MQCHNELIYLLWVLSKVKLFSFCRHLPEKIKDDQQLKNMSGQWFYEAKAKRHRDKIHGTDIIRASMRKKRLQVAGELIWLAHLQPAFVWEGGVGRKEGCQNLCPRRSFKGTLCITCSPLASNFLALHLDG